MKTKNVAICIIMLVMFMTQFTNTQAQRPRWELLGTRIVDYKMDKDVIPVTWREGAFNAIRIAVKGGSLNMHKCVIHFENGGIKEIELRHNFSRKSASRLIDLPGNNRLIEKIEFWYDTKNISSQRATILVYGRHLIIFLIRIPI